MLKNVSERNEENQKYILRYRNGEVIETLVKFYKLCNSEIALYPTTDASAAGQTGVVLPEALVPTLKVLINLTHTFHGNGNGKPLGSILFGEKPALIDTCLHLLFQSPRFQSHTRKMCVRAQFVGKCLFVGRITIACQIAKPR